MILKAAETALSPDEYRIVKVWYDDHYNNFPALPFNMEDWAGLTFMVPILRGSDWNGEINLTDEEELRNFKQYVSRS